MGIAMQRSAIALLTLGFGLFGAAPAHAHFHLDAPPAWSQQDDQGDPQKNGPCGGSMPTGVVTAFKPGETITITIKETVTHPGHYRVALALSDRAELPKEPVVTPDNTCGSAEIQKNPAFPVLADGMLQHTSAFEGPQSFQVTLPSDVTCDKCTLQVIEFMSEHPKPCFYYHCADISIKGDPMSGGGNGGQSGGGSAGSSGAQNGGTGAQSGSGSAGSNGGAMMSAGGSVIVIGGASGAANTGGALSSGGATAAGGSVDASGGALNSGGAPGSGGSSALSGGSSALSGGSSAVSGGGAGAAAPPDATEAGCSYAATGRNRRSSAAALFAALLLGTALRRRGRTRRA